MAAKQSKAVSTLSPKDDEDIQWTESAIFRIVPPDGADEEISHAAAAAAMNDRQLRLAASVFANTRDGIIITNSRGHILDANRAFTEMTGYTAMELVGRSPGVLMSEHNVGDFYNDLWRKLRRHGAWRGEVRNRRKNGEIFADLVSISAVSDATGTVNNYVAIYSDISELKRTQQRLEHLAYYDALTHLPNRVLLADRIQQGMLQVERHNKLMAVCFLDLDMFKPINDQFGHQAGDRLLVEVARRLKDSVRAGDTVARLGGDEFALILTELRDAAEADEVLGRVLDQVRKPYPVGKTTASVSASIGYTLVPPDGGDPDTLLRHADQAMYAAKIEGRDCCHIFDTEQDLRLRYEKQNESRIRQALDTGEFTLYYQPKVNMRSGKVVGLEALIRWNHPQRGLLEPADFLLSLGNSTLVSEIGDWVLGTALDQLLAWGTLGIELPVSINVSVDHLMQADFIDSLRGHLERRPMVRPQLLELEILETSALKDMDQVSQIIEDASRLGVTFALDDFGTGYSTLLYLKQLPANTLKIDQSFISNMLDDPEHLAIVEGILGLSSAFNREVVAEGVESSEHGVLLMQLNCDVVQGFGIARPMPAADVPGWIHHYTPDPTWRSGAARLWRRSDFPLVTAELEFKRWLHLFCSAVEKGDSGLLPRQMGRLADSRFGRWLGSQAAEPYRNAPNYPEIEPAHLKMRRTAAEINVLLNRGHNDSARDRLHQLREAMEGLIQHIRALLAEADSVGWPPPLADEH